MQPFPLSSIIITSLLPFSFVIFPESGYSLHPTWTGEESPDTVGQDSFREGGSVQAESTASATENKNHPVMRGKGEKVG